jgi:hypothetical protein
MTKISYIGEIKVENCLVVKDVSFESLDDQQRSYQGILTFTGGEKARLFCKENNETKKMYPFYVAVMNGTCPCCKKPNCSSLESKKGMLFEQVLKLKPAAVDFDAVNLLVSNS